MTSMSRSVPSPPWIRHSTVVRHVLRRQQHVELALVVGFEQLAHGLTEQLGRLSPQRPLGRRRLVADATFVVDDDDGIRRVDDQ